MIYDVNTNGEIIADLGDVDGAKVLLAKGGAAALATSISNRASIARQQMHKGELAKNAIFA